MSFSPSSSIIECFHGTSQESAKAIVEQEEGFVLKKDNNYLGKGVYFFSCTYSSAYSYAKVVKRIDNPAVIKANVSLGVCLNLLDKDMVDLVKRCGIKFSSKERDSDLRLGEIIDIMVKALGFDTIKAAYLRKLKRLRPYEGVKLYKKQSGSFVSNADVYICVPNKEMISNIEQVS